MCKTQKQIADICIYKCLDVCVKLFMNVNLVVLFLAPSIYTFPPCKLLYTPPTIYALRVLVIQGDEDKVEWVVLWGCLECSVCEFVHFSVG